MDQPLRTLLILGSTRQHRVSEALAPWIMSEAQHAEGVALELVDLRDWPLPLYDAPNTPSTVKDGQYPSELARAWAQKVAQADAYIIIAPEYNHGYPAVLKNAFDTVYQEWNNKPIAFVSYGSVGGARAVEQLRLVAVELQMAPIRQAVHIPAPWTMRDEQGAFKPGVLDAYREPLKHLLSQLTWWGKTLRAGRAHS